MSTSKNNDDPRPDLIKGYKPTSAPPDENVIRPGGGYQPPTSEDEPKKRPKPPTSD